MPSGMASIGPQAKIQSAAVRRRAGKADFSSFGFSRFGQRTMAGLTKWTTAAKHAATTMAGAFTGKNFAAVRGQKQKNERKEEKRLRWRLVICAS